MKSLFEFRDKLLVNQIPKRKAKLFTLLFLEYRNKKKKKKKETNETRNEKDTLEQE